MTVILETGYMTVDELEVKKDSSNSNVTHSLGETVGGSATINGVNVNVGVILSALHIRSSSSAPRVGLLDVMDVNKRYKITVEEEV